MNELYTAIKDNNFSKVKYLLENNEIDVNSKKYNNKTPLQIAYIQNRIEIIKLLILHGADVNVKNDADESILFLACEKNNIEIIKLFIFYGADVNITCIKWTPLHIACSRGNIRAVKLLLNHDKIDVNTKNCYNKTPLHYACPYINGSPNIKIIKLLLKHNANVNIKDNNDNNLLHYACKYPIIKIIKLVILHGADINAKNTDNMSPFDIIYRRNDRKILKLLIKCGAIITNNNIKRIQHDMDLKKYVVKYGVLKNIDKNMLKEYISLPGLSIITLLRNCLMPLELVLDLIDNRYSNNTIWEDFIKQIEISKKMKITF